MDTLTTIEHSELTECEAIIEHGLQTFYEVGEALLRIRDKRLYRHEFTSFEAYCEARWNMAKRTAYQFIAAAEVYETVRHGAQCAPLNERQVRPLTLLRDDNGQPNKKAQIKAWQQAVEKAPNGQVTGRHVLSIVNEMLDKPSSDKMQVHYSSEREQWNTPQEIIDRVLQVFTVIDLDPCSDSEDNPNVPATCVFTEQDDGLARAWFGKVYMNPPYGDTIKFWVDKLHVDFEDGRIDEAIALLPARTDTRWFRQLRDCPRCFIWGRLHFSDSANSAPFPSMVVYMGERVQVFADAFSDIGDIYIVY